MKTAIYCRISTSEQDSTMQKQLLLDYCKNNQLEVFDIYKDVISGSKDSRPEFNRMIDDMRARKFSCIIVYKLDRIGRSLQHLLQMFQEFENRGVKFTSITQNFDTSTPEGKLMMRMLMLLAEYERELIVARTRDTLDTYQSSIKEQGFFVSREGKKVKKLGRPKGSRDKVQRKKSGYYQRWANKSKKSTL